MPKGEMLKKLGLKTLFMLFREIRNHKLPYYTGLFGFSIVEASIVILLPIIIKIMIDAVLTNDFTVLKLGIVLALLEAVMASIIFIWVIKLFWFSVHRVAAEIKVRMMQHVLHLPVAFFEKWHSGDIISRITNDINNLYGALGYTLREILFTGFSGIGSAVVMIILDWRFSIILFVLGILSAVLNARFAVRIKGISDKLQVEMGKITERVSDLFAGHYIFKMFHITDRLDEKFMTHNEHARKLSIMRTIESNVLETTNHFISWINFGGIIALGAFLSINGYIGLSTVIAEMNLLGNVNHMIRTLGRLITNMQGSLAGADRVFELMRMEKEPPSCPIADCNVENSRHMIEMRGVEFSYDKAQVLKGVNMELGESKVAALVGTSGGGKSTIVKLLLGYYPPEKGVVFINHKPVWEYKLEELRGLIAYVPQDAYIFDGTIEENIRMGKENATSDEVNEAAKAANAYEFIEDMPEKMQTRVGERGVRLSGGQRQRIAIARAVLKNAPVLILDEATSSLDSQSEQLVQDALNALMKGKTSIVIAHRLSTIENADIIYVVDDGKIVEQGSHAELLDMGGTYKKLYDCQFSILTQ